MKLRTLLTPNSSLDFFRNIMNKKFKIMEERKTIYLCLAHMSEDGMEQKYVKEAFDTNWGA